MNRAYPSTETIEDCILKGNGECSLIVQKEGFNETVRK